jgi:hypothetical protein
MKNCLHFYTFLIFKYFENQKKTFRYAKIIKKKEPQPKKTLQQNISA